MFGTLFKDVSGSKMNHGADPEAVDGRTISEELTKHFAVSNFPTQSQGFVNTTVEDENNDLDIGKPLFRSYVNLCMFGLLDHHPNEARLEVFNGLGQGGAGQSPFKSDPL